LNSSRRRRFAGHALIVGAVSRGPHPEAAKLFVDWAMSKRGQAWYQTNRSLLRSVARCAANADRGAAG